MGVIPLRRVHSHLPLWNQLALPWQRAEHDHFARLPWLQGDSSVGIFESVIHVPRHVDPFAVATIPPIVGRLLTRVEGVLEAEEGSLADGVIVPGMRPMEGVKFPHIFSAPDRCRQGRLPALKALLQQWVVDALDLLKLEGEGLQVLVQALGHVVLVNAAEGFELYVHIP